MSNLYLVRHGQAGTRDAYDQLSELGRRQSRLLGEYFAAQRIVFSKAYSGSMRRQQETAEGVRGAYSGAQLSFPEIVVEEKWNEFNLDQVYREIAPALCAENAEFRAQYETLRERLRGNSGEASVHRRWLPCDNTVVKEWISGRHAYRGESWQEFCTRVKACHALFDNEYTQRNNVIVFTSSMPIGIWTAKALEIADDRVLRLAGVLYNSSFTVLRLRSEEMLLFSFNAAPHLSSAELRTHR